MATPQEQADLSKKRGQAAAQISDPDQRRKFVAAQGEAEKKGKGNASPEDYDRLSREADDTIATGGLNKSVGVPSYKHGTPYVPKTGLALLHKGEKVTPAKDNAVEQAVEHAPTSEKSHFHRAMSHLHKGALHRHLGIPEGQDIPEEKKKEAAASDNPHVAAMGRLAVAMHGWKHGKK